jgi:hypothetical protein
MDIINALAYLKSRHAYYSGYCEGIKHNPNFMHTEMLAHCELLDCLLKDFSRAIEFIESEQKRHGD